MFFCVFKLPSAKQIANHSAKQPIAKSRKEPKRKRKDHMGGNIYCLFCGGSPRDQLLGPGSMFGTMADFDTSHTLTAADSHFLSTVKVIFADTVTKNGTYDSGSRTVTVHNDDEEMRGGLLSWRIDSEAPGEREYIAQYYTESDDESVVVADEEDEEIGYDPDGDEVFSCDPAVTRSGALAHTICLRLYMALFHPVDAKTGSPESDSNGPLWDSEGRPCVQYYYEEEETDGEEVQIKTLDLDAARGRVSGITYGTEEQCKQDFVFVPEKAWMLARPDRFPPVPVLEPNIAKPTVLRGQSGLQCLPIELLTLLLQTIANGTDDPLSKGKTLLALAGTSPWLRSHITKLSNLWMRVCDQAEFFPKQDRTASAKAVQETLKAPTKYDWMAYFTHAAHSPSMRNRRRILRICKDVWDRLGHTRTADMSN